MVVEKEENKGSSRITFAATEDLYIGRGRVVLARIETGAPVVSAQERKQREDRDEGADKGEADGAGEDQCEHCYLVGLEPRNRKMIFVFVKLWISTDVRFGQNRGYDFRN